MREELVAGHALAAELAGQQGQAEGGGLAQELAEIELVELLLLGWLGRLGKGAAGGFVLAEVPELDVVGAEGALLCAAGAELGVVVEVVGVEGELAELTVLLALATLV